MNTIGEEILKLRQEGFNYNEIASKVNCSKATVSYYCSPGQKEKVKKRHDRYPKFLWLFIKRCVGFKQPRCYKTITPNQDWNNSFRTRVSHFRLRNKNLSQVFGYKEALEHVGGLQTKCYLTGRAINIENSEEYELDHIIPVSKGGSCELTNMGIACVAANQAKKDLSVEEFIQLCKEVCENFGYEVKKK